MDKMQKALLETIKETLPATQAEAVRESLNELVELRERVSEQEERLKAGDKRDAERVTRLHELERELQSANEQLTNALLTSDDLYDTVRRSEVTQARAELAAVERTQDRFLRNTVIREDFQRSVMATNQNPPSFGPNGSAAPGSVHSYPVSAPPEFKQTTTEPDEG